MINEISKDFFDAYRNNGSDGSEGMISVQSMPVAQALGDAQKRKETPTAIFAMGGGMPDAIRTHDLQSRSYQAVKPENATAQGFDWSCTNLRHFEEKPRKPYRARLPRFFAVVVK